MFAFQSVTELIKYIQTVCDNDSGLNNMSVVGEISGFKKYPSGHCYFTLKDSESVISCVMFAFYLNSLSFTPTEGMKVEMKCKAGIYASNGKFQLYVQGMKELGKGDLREQYNILYKKLSSEGLFDPSKKKSIPVMPRKIGVITSSSGAVVHDIINTLRRRNPFFDLTLFPSAVQGSQAPIDIIAGLDYFESIDDSVDVIIICRGGGSFEDLYCFNDERLARRIAVCEIPVISAVGHEVDYTICDFVSDYRVPTPTAAAEVVLPKFYDLQYNLMALQNDLDLAIRNYLKGQKIRLNSLNNHKALSGPEYQIKNEMSRLSNCQIQLDNLIKERLMKEDYRLKSIVDRIDLTSPLKILSRGYSITYDKLGKTVKSGDQLETGDSIVIKLSDSEVEAKVISVNKEGD